jgi:tetratricopeptide (TPR) repeat protein
MNMNLKMCKFLGIYNAAFILVILFIAATRVQAQAVTFQLEAAEGIMQAGDYIELRGNISEQYTWDDGLAMRLQSGLWQRSLPLENTQPVFEYKYVIVRNNGDVEWEEGVNRSYDSSEGGDTVTDYLRGFGGPQLRHPVQVLFELNSEHLSPDGQPLQETALLGGRPPLSWAMPENNLKMNSTDGKVWYAEVLFETGTLADLTFKFAFRVDGVWRWEELPGHIDHLLVMDPSRTHIAAKLRYDAELGRIVPEQVIGGELGNYAHAAATYGASRHYGYFRAVELLEEGNMRAARSMYNTHREEYVGTLIDDFDFLWPHKLAREGLLEEALSFARDMSQRETDSRRRAYFHYLRGELLLNSGQREAAREPLQQALKTAPEEDTERLIEGYAHLGLAISYLQEKDIEEAMKSRGHLFRLAHEHPDDQMQRLAWQKLADFSNTIDDQRGYENAMESLQTTGSERQRLRSRIAWAAYRMDHEPPDSVAIEIQELEAVVDDPHLAEEVQLIKAEHLLRTGAREQAMEILQQVEDRRRSLSASDRAHNRLQTLEPGGGR